MGQYEKVLPLARTNLERSLKVLGPDHASTMTAKGRVANALEGLGHNDESLAIREEIVADRRRVFGPSHNRTLQDDADGCHSVRFAWIP